MHTFPTRHTVCGSVCVCVLRLVAVHLESRMPHYKSLNEKTIILTSVLFRSRAFRVHSIVCREYAGSVFTLASSCWELWFLVQMDRWFLVISSSKECVACSRQLPFTWTPFSHTAMTETSPRLLRSCFHLLTLNSCARTDYANVRQFYKQWRQNAEWT